MGEKGKFIVLYGINNLGKTTQAKLLVERLIKEGYKAEYLKYPLYELAPAGPLINGYLRENNPYQLTPREFQVLHVLNRMQYEPVLKSKLAAGINIVAEDYLGTGLAWGIGAGVDEEFLKKINSHLLPEDLVLLFGGKRFSDGIEDVHLHERDEVLMEKVRLAHQKLAEEYGWRRIKANETKEKISENIWQIVKTIL